MLGTARILSTARQGSRSIVGKITPTISANIIEDSVSNEGKRITTFELEYPRFVHAEFMTHRLFSRNAASSRAIPVEKQLKTIQDKPACPIHWGANQRGMKANEECDNYIDLTSNRVTKENAWLSARSTAMYFADKFSKAGYHKQIVNRLTEPFSHIKVICTATEYENFFWLRCHPDAQPEIQVLASEMFDAMEANSPRVIEEDEWHLPYVDDKVRNEVENYLLYSEVPKGSGASKTISTFNSVLLRVSASCCAQVSYRTLDTSVDKSLRIYDQLVNNTPVHASPFEHQAKPILPTHNYSYPGITHTGHRDGARWSGNFKWWIQYRQLIEGHTKW